MRPSNAIEKSMSYVGILKDLTATVGRHGRLSALHREYVDRRNGLLGC